MKVHPAGFRLLLKMDKVKEEKTGIEGFEIVDPAKDKRRDQAFVEVGTVVEVGRTAFLSYDDGKPWAQVGDRVMIQRYAGHDLADIYKETGDFYRIIQDEDIIATIEDK